MAEVNPRKKFDPKASNLVAAGSLPAIAGVTAGKPGSFSPSHALLPATLAALKANGVVGDAGSAKPGAAWATDEYVVLGDKSNAFWDGTAWMAGEATFAAEPEPEAE